MNKTQIYETIIDKLNEEQKEAVEKPLNWCTKIVAGAGTGKTEIISRRFAKLTVDLIDNSINNPATRVLVITFTDKAATNMKDRIIKTLKQFDIDVINSELWISTFHSFCSKILKKHSLEVNLSPQCELADDKTQKEIYDNITKKIIYNESNFIANLDSVACQLGLNKNVLSIPNIQKINDISSPEVVFNSIYYVIKKIKSLGLTPNDFLDKSLKSTREFTDIVKTIPFGFDDKESYQNAWELHLKPYIEDTIKMQDSIFNGICSTKTILDKNGKRKALEWCYASGYPENIDHINTLEIYLCTLTSLIYALYQNYLIDNDLIDYDDQINYTIEILKNNDTLRKYYQAQFKHIIIDEFQDTSGSQLELVKLLLNPEEPNITFVGDRKQSIYGFRYAQMENLEVLHQYLQSIHNKEYKEVKLKTNYRSTPHVLEPVNILTQEHLMLDEKLYPNMHKEFDMKNKNVQLTRILFDNGIKDARVAEAKYIATEIAGIKENNKGVKYKDIAVLVSTHSRAELIEQYLKGAGIPAVKKQDNNYFKEPVVKNLLALMRLANNPRDEIAFVRVLEIQLNQNELYMTKKSIYELMPDEAEFKYNTNLVDKVTYLKQNNMIERLNINNDTKLYINTIIENIIDLSSQAQNMSLVQLFQVLTNTIPVYYNLPEVEAFNANKNIKIFEKILVDYTQSEHYDGLRGFIEALDTYQNDKNFELPAVSNTEIDAVQLLTIHASKGLEFPYVFVTSQKSGSRANTNVIELDFQYGNKPGFGLIAYKYKGNDTPKRHIYKEIWEKPRELNENKRLFYVAISRAEKYLNIINLIDPDKKTNVPDYTSDIICQEQTIEIPSADILYVKGSLNKSTPVKIKKILPDIENLGEPVRQIDSLKLSFSKLNSFNHCPEYYLWKYKYYYPELKKESSSTNIGSIIHNMIYNSLIRKKAYNEKEIQGLLPEDMLDAANLKRITTLYNKYLESHYAVDKIVSKDFKTEKKFVFTEEYQDVSVEFAGDIDLIVKNSSNGFDVIDFKTNKDIAKSLENYYIQLFIYQKALNAEGISVNHPVIVNLTEDGYKDYIPTKAELLQAEKTYYDTLKAIIESHKQARQTEIKKTDRCYLCGYKYLLSVTV